jgi:hypothetical protein
MSRARNRHRQQPRSSGAGRPQARAARPAARVDPRSRVAAASGASTVAEAGLGDTRHEWLWQGGLTFVAAAIYLTTFSSHVALGDAPESVAGVRTLGILHAPGYPSYVVVARLFGTVVPLGTWAFRVNLFSLVCASLTIGVVFRVARHFGATRVGASVGALALATTASFWFNAGFAKYYAFTALMLAGAALAALAWEERGSSAALLLSGLLLGASFGSGWQLAAIMAVALALLVGLGQRQPTLQPVLGGVAALAITSVAGLAFLVVRAIQDPTLNWGAATTPSRLVALIARRDFSGAVSGKAGDVATRLETLLGGMARDFGIVAVVIAVYGAIELYRRRVDIGRVVFLASAAVLNLVAVAIGSAISEMWGFANVVPAGGYLLATMIVVAVLVGVGATALIEFVVHTAAERAGASRSGAVGWLRSVTVLALLAVVVVPSLVVHRDNAELRVTPLADRYGSRVLEALPRNAVLLVWGEEYSMPMLYRQLVDRERPDVAVVSANAIRLDWARDQLTRRLHLGSALRLDREDRMLRRMIAKIRETRPVFLDMLAMDVLGPYLPYRTHGFVGEVVDGKDGPHPVSDLDALVREVNEADTLDGLNNGAYRRLVYVTVYTIHEGAHLELANAYVLEHNLSAAIRQVRLANAVNPVLGETLSKLETLSPRDAEALILSL